MNRILKIKDYLKSTYGQFIPIEWIEHEEFPSKVRRIKDNKIFTAGIEYSIYKRKFMAGYVEVQQEVYIDFFYSDCINVEVGEFSNDDTYNLTSSSFKQIEINDLEDLVELMIINGEMNFMEKNFIMKV